MAKYVFRLVLGAVEGVGRRRECFPHVAGRRRFPGADDPEQLRLVGCEPKRGFGLARAVDADESGWGSAHSSDPCGSASLTR
jgi:hypothetical protein